MGADEGHNRVTTAAGLAWLGNATAKSGWERRCTLAPKCADFGRGRHATLHSSADARVVDHGPWERASGSIGPRDGDVQHPYSKRGHILLVPMPSRRAMTPNGSGPSNLNNRRRVETVVACGWPSGKHSASAACSRATSSARTLARIVATAVHAKKRSGHTFRDKIIRPMIAMTAEVVVPTIWLGAGGMAFYLAPGLRLQYVSVCTGVCVSVLLACIMRLL